MGPSHSNLRESGDSLGTRTDNYDMGREVSVEKIIEGVTKNGSRRPAGIPVVECYNSVDQEPGNKVKSSMKKPSGAKGGYKKGGY